MTQKEFDYEIGVLKAKIEEIDKKYIFFADNYKARIVGSVGQSLRYAQIAELLVPYHKMLSMYNSTLDGISEEFRDSLEAEMGNTEVVNFKLRKFNHDYGYEMSRVNKYIYLLNEEKLELEQALNYKIPPVPPISPETDPSSPDGQA